MAVQTKPHRSRDPDRNAGLLCAVLERDGRRLGAQARRHADSAADAEEAFQAACILFLERYNGIGEPLAWLYTTVKREAWALRRRSARRRESSFEDTTPDGVPYDLAERLPDEAPPPEERALQAELHAARRATLAQLKPAERTALLLRALGYTYEEIMALQDWTYTKVNRSLAEGRAALRAGADVGGCSVSGETGKPLTEAEHNSSVVS